MRRREKVFAVLPTLLTLGNAACGFGCITFAAKLGPEPTQGTDPLLIASLLIFLGMVFDMLDGSAARLTRQTSDFGAELDSLCDAITFGVAPAFLMVQFCRDYHGRLLFVIATLYVVCTVLRLARFNVETDEEDTHEFFSGLPSPAAAGTVAAFPIAQHGLNKILEAAVPTQPHYFTAWLLTAMKVVLPFITLWVACLMVSRIRYPHIFNQLFRGPRNRRHLIQLVFAAGAVYIVREMAVPVIFAWYSFASPVRALGHRMWERLKSKQTSGQEPTGAQENLEASQASSVSETPPSSP